MLEQAKRIPLFEPSYGKEERAAVMKVLDEGYLNEGKYVREFEQKFAEFVGAKYCVMVPSGQLALEAGLSMLAKNGIVYYDVLKVPCHYGIFAANALMATGRVPVLTDVDVETGLIVTSSSETLVVHANGRIGATHRVADCCQAITQHEKYTISCYSFHSTKMITAMGIGGAVCCDEDDVYLRLWALKDHGRAERGMGKPVSDIHSMYGSNRKMSDANAAFALEQLKKLPGMLERFNKIYLQYQELLGHEVQWLSGIPQWRVDCLIPNPQRVIEYLEKHGIEAKRFYLPLYAQLQYLQNQEFYPNTDYLYQHGLYLPSSPALTDAQIHFICDKIKEALQ